MDKAKKASKPKVAGRSASGNVTVDLGEAIEKKIRNAGLRRTEVAGVGPSWRTGRTSSFRPGMYGGYRPWLGRFSRPWLGQEGVLAPVTRSLLPVEIRTVKTGSLIGGLGLGIVANRILMRISPMLWKNPSLMLHEGIAFVAGLLPVLIQRSATTVGLAVPGAVALGGSLVDLLLNLANVPQPALSGSAGSQRVGDASSAARQRLAQIQQRIQAPRPVQQRAVAQAV